MKHIIFDNKEQYLAMKQHWATYFNTEARNLERDEYGHKTRKLKSTHFILYAILRGKNPYDCIQNCDGETVTGILYDIKIAKDVKYGDHWRTKWTKFFNITDEQYETLIDIAFEIFCNRKEIETIKEEMTKIHLTQPIMMECLS